MGNPPEKAPTAPAGAARIEDQPAAGLRDDVPTGASLKTKVGILIAGFSVIGFGGAGLVAYRQMRDLARHASIEHARAVLEALAIPAAHAITRHEHDELREIIGSFAATHPDEITVLVAIDRHGTALASSATSSDALETFSREFVAASRGALSFTVRFARDPDDPTHLDIAMPFGSNPRLGTLLARFSLEPYHRQLHNLAAFMIPLTVGVIVIGWFLALILLGRLVLDPARKLADIARRIGNGDFSTRWDLRRGDEIGGLAHSLQKMSGSLERHTSGLRDAVLARTLDLERANAELARLATTDEMTGLRNHRYFQETLVTELRRIARHPRPLALCMLDLDHFKTFNDTYGHQAGDDVLRRAADILQSSLRSTDVAARYGGEEFVAILFDTTAAEGLRTAEKLCARFRTEVFPGEDVLPSGKLTVSVGVAAFPEDAIEQKDLIRAADLALYESKRRGRNQVVRYDLGIAQKAERTLDVPRGPKN